MSFIPLPVDTFSGAVETIDWEHSRIHSSKGFLVNGKHTIANGASLDVLLSNPAANYPHLRAIEIAATAAPFDARLYEGVTVSANGTAATVKNYNRNSVAVANVLAYTGPTVTGTGTELECSVIPGAKQTGGSGFEGAQTEWILKPSTLYLVRFTNNSGGSANASIKIFWYEGG